MNLNTLGPPAAGDTPGDGNDANILAELRGSSDGASGVPDLSTAAAPKRRLSVQNLIIVLAVVGSVGALFMMRQQGRSAGVSFTNVKIEPPPEPTGPRFPDQARILADLARSTHASTLPEKLDKNPFKFDAPAPLPGEPAPAGVDPEAERTRTLLATLQINAIMQGPTPVARINGRLVRVGDQIDGLLMVSQINDRSVDFIGSGKTYTVNMGDGTHDGAPRRGNPAPRPPHPYGPPREK